MKTFLIVFACLFFPYQSFGAGFTVTPMLQEITLENSESEEVNVTIANTTTEEVVFELSAIDFQGLDESGGVAFLGTKGDGDQSYPLALWMEPETSLITLPPESSATVRVKIRNDETLSPGGHYGALVFRQASSSPSLEQPKITLQQVFTALFLVKKVDGARYGLELETWQDKTTVLNPLSSHEIVFRATGNVHITPRGEVGIIDPFGRQVAKGIVNEASAIILPGEKRKYSVQISPIYSLWMPGNYQIVLKYRYDGRESFDLQEKVVFFMPLRTIFSALTILLILVGAIFYRKRRKKAQPV